MTLPTFLSIGAQRSGSTWLYHMLRSHPEIFVPPDWKNINYFNNDTNYSYGLPWYEKFFPEISRANEYSAIGECTDSYIYNPLTPSRIAGVPSIKQLILILRNPVDRAYSQYGVYLKEGKISSQIDFGDFVFNSPDTSFVNQTIGRGKYAQYIKNFLQYFKQEQFLVLIMEYATTNVEETRQQISQFLTINIDLFPEAAGYKTVNESSIPQSKVISNLTFTLMYKLWDKLHRRGLLWMVTPIKKLGVGTGSLSQLLAKKKLPPLQEDIRQRLYEVYRNDIDELENLFDLDLTGWKYP